MANLTLLQRESLTLRFERSLRSVLPRIDEPQALQMADHLGRVAVEALRAPQLAVPALLRAVFLAPAAHGYDGLRDWATALAGDSDDVLAAIDNNTGAGRSLLELAAAIADAADDGRRATALLVRAAAIDPDDAEFAQRVVDRARSSGDSQQLRLALEVVPPKRRAQTLLQEAGGARESGDLESEVEALQQVRSTPGLEPHVRAQVFERLSSLLAQSGRRDDLGALLTSELQRDDLERHERVRVGRDLAALAAARGQPVQAIEVLEGLEELMSPRIYFEDMLAYGRQADSHRLMIRALTRLVDLSSDIPHKVDLLRELARTLQLEGDEAGATSRFEELLVLAPTDDEALLALEKQAENRDDYERMTALLQRRAELADSVADVRGLRMRRARLLEGELGRPDDAIAELEALVVTTGDDREALRQLAELHERRGGPARAAPLWLRASGTATDKHEAAEFTRRACEAYLQGGDLDAARRVLDGLETWARSAEMQQLRVDVERRSNNPRALAEALEELALASMDPAPKRASLLVEAARASYAGGDPSKLTRSAAVTWRTRGAGGIVAIHGGKLTTHRDLAETVMRRLERMGARCGRPWTRGAILPGGGFTPAELAIHAGHGPEAVAPGTRRRWARTYGDRIMTLYDRIAHHPESAPRNRQGRPRSGAAPRPARRRTRQTADDFLRRRTKLFMTLPERGQKAVRDWFGA